jgi:hypothetical protein
MIAKLIDESTAWKALSSPENQLPAILPKPSTPQLCGPTLVGEVSPQMHTPLD